MNWRHYLIPSSYLVIIFTVVSLVWLVGANLDVVAMRILPQTDLPIGEVAHQNLTNFLNWLAGFSILNTIIPAAFWVGVALIANLILWGVKNVWIDTENQYIVERHYTNKGKLGRRYKFILRQLGLALITIALIIFSAQSLLTFELTWFREVWLAFSAVNLYKALGAVLLSVINLHLVWALVKMTFSVE